MKAVSYACVIAAVIVAGVAGLNLGDGEWGLGILGVMAAVALVFVAAMIGGNDGRRGA